MHSYERQNRETTKAYAAFCLYRDMGVVRSMKTTAQKFYTPHSPHISTAGGEMAARGLAIEELMKQVQNECDSENWCY